MTLKPAGASKPAGAENPVDPAGLAHLEYRLAEHHELMSRIAATMTPRGCAIRGCYRDGCCTGPMVESERTERAQAAQRFMGYSGKAVACLPLCIASADDKVYALYLEKLELVKALCAADAGFLPAASRWAKARPRLWPHQRDQG